MNTQQGKTEYKPSLRWRIKCAWWRVCEITHNALWFSCGPYRRWKINQTMRGFAKLQRESSNECVSDGHADAVASTRSAEGPFAARNG